jgi:hypothetical protein
MAVFGVVTRKEFCSRKKKYVEKSRASGFASAQGIISDGRHDHDGVLPFAIPVRQLTGIRTSGGHYGSLESSQSTVGTLE